MNQVRYTRKKKRKRKECNHGNSSTSTRCTYVQYVWDGEKYTSLVSRARTRENRIEESKREQLPRIAWPAGLVAS
jgi:hypothetical protein